MTDHNFVLKVPRLITRDQYRLLGGRYCNINGKPAVHLRFVDNESDRQVSLFQTKMVEELDDLDASTLRVDDLSIEHWEEDDRFYILARS